MDHLDGCLVIVFFNTGDNLEPHQFNATRRHKFDKAQYRVIHWEEYYERLRQRGDLPICVSEKAQSVWSAPHVTA